MIPYECGACPPSLSGDGLTCFDFNECESNDTNDCEQNCHNILNGYECSCYDGFTLSLDQRSCIDNEGCTPTAMNDTGSPNCTCASGYEFKNATCSDFDECSNRVDTCPDTSTCVNTDGDYFCDCAEGYDTNNETKTCADIDECGTSSDNCSAPMNRICMNTAGNFTCVCQLNFAESSSGVCMAATTVSFEERFDFINGLTVADYPDTIESEANRERLAEEVFELLNGTVLLGSGNGLVAVLVTNFTVIGISAVIEFRVDTFQENVNSSFVKDVFTDALPSSRIFGSNNRIAEPDLDECMEYEAACSNGNCTNTDGGFYCTCDMGFEGDGTDSCTDIDECLGENDCQDICNNEDGGYSCACSDGYELDGGGYNCTVMLNATTMETATSSNATEITATDPPSTATDITATDQPSTATDITATDPPFTVTDITATDPPSTATDITATDPPSTATDVTATDQPSTATDITATDPPSTATDITATNPSTNATAMTVTDPATTMAPQINVLIVVAIRLDTPFSTDLQSRENSAFINLANAICNFLIRRYRRLTSGNIACVVLRFTEGSVNADVEMNVPANSTSEAAAIMNIAQNISSMDVGNITDENNTALYNVISFNANVTISNDTIESTTMAAATGSIVTPPADTTTMAAATPETPTGSITSTPADNTPMAAATPETSTGVIASQPSVNTSMEAATPETTTGAALATRRLRTSIRVVARNGVALEYTSDLAIPGSSYFQELELLFCNVVNTYLTGRSVTLSTFSCIAVSFSPGSVVGNLQIDISAPTEEQANTIAQAAADISTLNIPLTSGNDTLTLTPRPEAQGLSTGAIIAIVLGVVVAILLFIVCSCCVLAQMASRNNAAKPALGEAYHGPYARDSPVFLGDDPWFDSHSNQSLDRREFAVGQAVGRLTQDRGLYGEGNRRPHTRTNGHEHFRTPYVVGGDEVQTVERNPIYY